MIDNNETTRTACLERTRSWVLNVLMAVGLGISASGLLLRWRDRWAATRAPRETGPWLLIALVVVVAASYLTRRWLAGRNQLQEPSTRFGRFFQAHVLAALIGALAVPLGLVYGWFVRPRLDAVGPFWVAALALGFLSIPRGSGLDDFDETAIDPQTVLDPDRKPIEPMIS